MARTFALERRRACVTTAAILIGGTVASVFLCGWSVLLVFVTSGACGLVLMRLVGPAFVRAAGDWKLPFVATVLSGIAISVGLSMWLTVVPGNAREWVGFIVTTSTALWLFSSLPTVFYPDGWRARGRAARQKV